MTFTIPEPVFWTTIGALGMLLVMLLLAGLYGRKR